MNPEKLKKLQAEVRIGGKGSQRRKKKIVHTTPSGDDKKLQGSMKKLSFNVVPGIEEVNIFKTDGTVLHFKNPKTQAAVAINTFTITGNPETKSINELLPGVLLQLGAHDFEDLQKTTGSKFCYKDCAHHAGLKTGETKVTADNADDDDDIPQLVKNFEAVALEKDDKNTNENKHVELETIFEKAATKLLENDCENINSEEIEEEQQEIEEINNQITETFEADQK